MLAVENPSSSLVPAGLALDQAQRAFGLTVVPGGTGNTDTQARVLRDLGIALYCGTPSFLVKLLDRAEELGYQEELRLRHAVLGAEAFPGALRDEVTRRGVTPIQTYGTADVGRGAGRHPGRGDRVLVDERPWDG